MNNCLANHKITQIFTRRQYYGSGLRALSKNIVIYHRGERRVRRVLRRFQQLLRFSGASTFSVCSAVKFRDIPISLENSTVPPIIRKCCLILGKHLSHLLSHASCTRSPAIATDVPAGLPILITSFISSSISSASASSSIFNLTSVIE